MAADGLADLGIDARRGGPRRASRLGGRRGRRARRGRTRRRRRAGAGAGATPPPEAGEGLRSGRDDVRSTRPGPGPTAGAGRVQWPAPGFDGRGRGRRGDAAGLSGPGSRTSGETSPSSDDGISSGLGPSNGSAGADGGWPGAAVGGSGNRNRPSAPFGVGAAWSISAAWTDQACGVPAPRGERYAEDRRRPAATGVDDVARGQRTGGGRGGEIDDGLTSGSPDATRGGAEG